MVDLAAVAARFQALSPLADERVRRLLAAAESQAIGKGGIAAVDKDPSLKTDLEALLESTTRGDPQASLRWTAKSVRQLAAELERMKRQVSQVICCVTSSTETGTTRSGRGISSDGAIT